MCLRLGLLCGLGVEQVHCTPGMSYEESKGPGVEQVPCTSGMLYDESKDPGIE